MLYLGSSLVAFLLAATLVILFFGASLLDGYGRKRAERSFAQAHPGSVLRIGQLTYVPGDNRLVARSVFVNNANQKFTADQISLTGVSWARHFWRTTSLAELLAQASVDATNLNWEFPRALYGIRCARLRASVPASELIAEGTELHALVGDEEFFAAHQFRATRFRVALPECRVTGLAFRELIRGEAYRAESIHLSRLSLDTLTNRDKSPPALDKSPLMVHEALALIRRPLQVGAVSLTDGQLHYCERLAVGTEPGVLTLGAISLAVDGLANRGETNTAIQVRGEAELMNAGKIQVLMSIPIASPNFSLHYSGSLGAMDLTRLSAFLDAAEHTRIKSGIAHEAAFEIAVADGHARGHLTATYSNLEIARLDKLTGDEKGMGPRVSSFVVNVLKIRNASSAEGSASRKKGEINYTRKPDDEFQQFIWFALRTGVLDLISR